MSSSSIEADAVNIASCCSQQLTLQDAVLGNEYFYQSLPLCIIDAVYSIGVKYEGVQNVVRRYCRYFDLKEFREPRERIPLQPEQQSLFDFIETFTKIGVEKFTDAVFQNRQRTSSRNGILKSDAVFRFAKACYESDMNFLQDVGPRAMDARLETDLRKIPGQSISIGYFFMLAGSDDLVKPDRWILSFLTRCLGRSAGVAEAQALLFAACEIIRVNHPNLKPRLLDNLIWRYERGRT
jgi:hypothetical protein